MNKILLSNGRVLVGRKKHHKWARLIKICFNVTDDQRLAICEAAESSGESIAAWCRRIILSELQERKPPKPH